MSALQIVAAGGLRRRDPLVAVALFVRVISQFLATFRLGQPDATRTGDQGRRYA